MTDTQTEQLQPTPEAAPRGPAGDSHGEEVLSPNGEAPLGGVRTSPADRVHGPRRIAVALLVVAVVIVAAVLVGRGMLSNSRNTYSGIMQPAAAAELSFPTAGPLDALLVRPGQRVAKGQALARQAAGLLPNLIAADTAAVKYDQQHQTAINLEPVLFTQDQAEHSAQLVAAAAQTARDQAQLLQVTQQLAALTLTSPIAGVVADVNGNVGELVGGTASAPALSSEASSASSFSLFPPAPQQQATSTRAGYQPVVTVMDDSSWNVIAQVPETAITHIRAGTVAKLTIGAVKSHLTGRVTAIGATPQTVSGKVYYAVELAVEHPSSDLRLGLSTSVTFPEKS